LQATSQSLREQLDETYQDLKLVVDEKRKLYQKISKKALEEEENEYMRRDRNILDTDLSEEINNNNKTRRKSSENRNGDHHHHHHSNNNNGRNTNNRRTESDSDQPEDSRRRNHQHHHHHHGNHNNNNHNGRRHSDAEAELDEEQAELDNIRKRKEMELQNELKSLDSQIGK
jgi:hypothetical protein